MKAFSHYLETRLLLNLFDPFTGSNKIQILFSKNSIWSLRYIGMANIHLPLLSLAVPIQPLISSLVTRSKRFPLHRQKVTYLRHLVTGPASLLVTGVAVKRIYQTVPSAQAFRTVSVQRNCVMGRKSIGN